MCEGEVVESVDLHEPIEMTGFHLYGEEHSVAYAGYTVAVYLPNEVASGLPFGWYFSGENE